MKKREQPPCLVEFSEERVELVNDGSERQRHVYQLQNRGPGSVRLRAAVAADSDPVFALLSGAVEKYVAPGLKVSVVLQYSPGGDGDCHRGSLEVFVNSSLSLTIPITAVPPSPRLHLSQEVVDVGSLVTDHQIHATSFSLSNLGSRVGTFSIDVSPLPAWISLRPTSGRLDSLQTSHIQMEILCKEEAEFSYTLRIQSSNLVDEATPPLLLTVCGRLQSRALRVLDPLSGSTLHCVTFDPTYYDTTTSRQVIVYNDSPVSTDYLCLLDKSALGNEVGGAEGVAMALTEGGIGQGKWREQGSTPATEQLLAVEPSQDSLLPYEKRRVELTFAPTFISSDSGWSRFKATPTRRDYTLYLRFMAVHTNRDGKSSPADLEVAVCATALPVDVLLEPSTPLEFGVSPTMIPSTHCLKVHNKSDTLPLHFTTHRLPHYTCHPPSGHISPSHTLTLSITFTPKQLGPLNGRLLIEILAQKSKSGKGGGVVKMLVVELKGEGVSREPSRRGEENWSGKYAHPDDLATSIRPYDGYKVVTPYTQTPRYTYVDRDYAHSQGERRQIQRHRDQYLHYLRDCQTQRQWDKREKALLGAVCGPERELGMLSLKAPSNSPAISGSSPSKTRRRGRLDGRAGIMTTDDMATATSVELREIEQCSRTADSPQVASEVTARLSPHQLSLITITPGALDYGVIAVGSVVEMAVTMKNGLNQYVCITFKLEGSGVQCSTLPSSSNSASLPHILPPLSFTRLPLTMQRDTTGVLERCVECLVNNQHIVRLPVHVETVPLSLSLSANTLTLSQPPIAPPTAGLRGSLEVVNGLNVPASFQWHAREGVDTSVFFMIHPTGVVPAHSSLRCEFACLPTYESADSALFRLVVLGEEGGAGKTGDNLLSLKAELGRPVCCFRERRVLFGSVPLGLTTVRTVHLQNSGDCHAFFKVVNPEPCAGMKVHPESGCVPAGGASDLQLQLCPGSEALFDTELVVAVRGGRRLTLKLVGTAVEPRVTIDRESFVFGGVCCGSTSSLPFTVSNLGSTRCELLFDFSFLSDFSLDLPQQTSPYGLRGSLEVVNGLNVPASFQWHAREGVDTSVFFMIHPTGVVPAHSSLRCEFACLPTYESADSALFRLVVLGEEGGAGKTGDNLLSLKAELGRPVCCFRERRVLFGSVPLGLTTVRTVHLQNSGDCHAFFKVVNPEPCAGMKVHPESGCVPAGGASDLQLQLCPGSEALFDTELVVAVRGGRRLTLKLVGTAVEPRVTIDRESFVFGGVCCGSTSSLPFTVSNLGSTRCELLFDFSFLSDFSLDLPQQTSPYAEVTSGAGDLEGVYTLQLPAKTSTQCHLILSPKDVAAYDFQLPVLVNGARPHSPPPSPWPPSPHHSSKIAVHPPTHQHNGTKTEVLGSYESTPRRRVLATAVRAPVSLSLSHFSFSLPVGHLETMAEPLPHSQPAELRNVGESPIWWTLVTSGSKRLEDGTFRLVAPSGDPLPLPPPDFGPPGPMEGEVGHLQPQESCQFSVLCSPGHHGEFEAEVPLLLCPATTSGSESSPQPYCSLTLRASVPASKLSLSTSCILLQPVPLDITISAQYSLLLHNFPNAVNMEVMVPPSPDGASLAVKFPGGSQVAECGEEGVELPVELEFSSSQPVSLSGHLVFRDTNSGKKVRVAYAVAADNSVLSVAQFLAQSVTISSVQLNNQHIPTLSVASATGGVVSTSSAVSLATSQTRHLSSTPLSTSLSEYFSYSDIFMQECVNAVCRWVSSYGWSEGVRHVTSPTDLRERVGHNVPKRGVKQRSSLRVERGQLVELVSHLCGRLPPGVPMNPPPSSSPSEMINQHYSTLTTIISFLQNQGGQEWCLTADSLLDYTDYQQWLLDCRPCPSLLPPASSPDEFQERSSQAWTYLLLLLIKVLVLPRVVRQVPLYLRQAARDLQNPSDRSNVYGQPERVILAWLNHHYCQQRATVLGSTGREEVREGREGREVVSFDMDLMDCTVLACVLSAYCPFLVSSHFSALYCQPSSQEQCSHNALVLVDALSNIGITYDCQASDLTTPTPVFLLLLCCHLYQTLPSLSPSPSPSLSPPPLRTILCEGLLHSNIRRKITLDNPSSRPLTYRALLRGEGASKFSIVGGSDTITIEGGEGASVEVQYRGSHLRPTEATLLLVSGSRGRGTSMAFLLQGRVTGAKPQARVQVGGALYQPQTVSLPVTSSFQTSAPFDISLYESTEDSLLFSLSPNRKKTATQSLGVIPVTALQKRTTDRIRSFNPRANQLHLTPGVSTNLDLTFVPLVMEPRHCTVVLSNETLGEMVLSLTASVQLPFPTLPKTDTEMSSHLFLNPDTQTVHIKAYVGERVREQLLVCSENPALERALLELCQWGMDQEELRRRLLTNSLGNAALVTARDFLQLDQKTPPPPPSAADSADRDLDKLVFSVEGSDENFKLPSTVSVPACGGGGVGRLPVEFVSEEPGQFECRVVLRSAHEVRVFIIESTVLAKGREAWLEFTTTAMQPLTQDIPIVNPSTVGWPLKASLTGSGFTGPDSLLSQPLSTTCYPLTFNPKKEGTIEGELCLVNGSDGTEHRFQLRGVAEKPLAQDYIVLHTRAKISLTHILHVPNHNERTTEFQVESDLECVSGPPSITITGGDLVDYPLLVRPIRRGVVSGAVAFVAQAPSARHRRSLSAVSFKRGQESSPHHVWFQLEVRAEPAPPNRVVTITCPALSSTVTHLPITNTHPHPLQLSVVVGGACDSGPDSLLVDAESITNYPLTFAPSLTGNTSGEVVFDGSPDGEFWYQLQLLAEDPAPVTLPRVTCELGKTMQVSVPLTNPLDHSVTFSCECSNTRHFIIPALTDCQVEVEAGASIEVPVLFKPSCVGSGEHVTHVSFTSQQFGEQVFVLQGEGSEPSKMEPTTIWADLNSNTTHVVSFTNPLDTPTHFQVVLSDPQPSESFCLLLKRTHGILLRPGVSLDIPIMFVPEEMHTHRATMIVSTEGTRSGARLVWRYPIVGEPQFRPVSAKSAPRIVCRAKERVEEQFQVVLVSQKMKEAAGFRPVTPNLDSTSGAAESPTELLTQSGADGYSYELVCGDGEYSALIRDSVVVQLLRKTVDGEGPIKLVFGFVFVPPRAFSCTAELNVRSSGSGGVWKFPVHLSSTMADSDDVIVIESSGLNRESQIQFRLTSMQEHPLPFTAHLGHGSDPDITVSPTSGELAPVNSRGTLFFITYKPRIYGRVHKARLIVNCQSSEWCYEIVGRPAGYSPPSHTAARVKHRATPPLILTQTRKNFVRENMKLGKSRQPVQ